MKPPADFFAIPHGLSSLVRRDFEVRLRRQLNSKTCLLEMMTPLAAHRSLATDLQVDILRKRTRLPGKYSAEWVLDVGIVRRILHGRGDGREVSTGSATQHRCRRWRIPIDRAPREPCATAGRRTVRTSSCLAV